MKYDRKRCAEALNTIHAIRPSYTKTRTDKDTATQTAHARSQSVIFSQPLSDILRAIDYTMAVSPCGHNTDSAQSRAGRPEDCGQQQAEERDPTRILVAFLQSGREMEARAPSTQRDSMQWHSTPLAAHNDTPQHGTPRHTSQYRQHSQYHSPPRHSTPQPSSHRHCARTQHTTTQPTTTQPTAHRTVRITRNQLPGPAAQQHPCALR